MTFCWLQTDAWCSIQRLQRLSCYSSIRTDMKREESGPKMYIGKDDYLKKNTQKRFVGLLLNSCLASQLFLVSPDPLSIPTQPIPNSVHEPAPCLNQKMSYMKLKHLTKQCNSGNMFTDGSGATVSSADVQISTPPRPPMPPPRHQFAGLSHFRINRGIINPKRKQEHYNLLSSNIIWAQTGTPLGAAAIQPASL